MGKKSGSKPCSMSSLGFGNLAITEILDPLKPQAF